MLAAITAVDSWLRHLVDCVSLGRDAEQGSCTLPFCSLLSHTITGVGGGVVGGKNYSGSEASERFETAEGQKENLFGHGRRSMDVVTTHVAAI